MDEFQVVLVLLSHPAAVSNAGSPARSSNARLALPPPPRRREGSSTPLPLHPPDTRMLRSTLRTRHRSRPLRPAAFVALALFSACHYDGTADDPLAARANQLIDELNIQSALYCDCYDERGYTDREQCESEESIGPAQRRCTVDALTTRDAPASQQYLDCLLPLEREFTDCINGRLKCLSPDSDRACLEDYQIGLAACIELPLAVERALDDCHG